MTQEEIIELVMQIGGCDRPEDDSPALKMFVTFAKLVEEKAIKEALAQPEQEPVAWEQFHEHMAGPFYKAPPQPEKEPVAWGVFECNLHDMFFTEAEAVEMAQLKGTHAEVRPLHTTPLQRTWVGLTEEEVNDLYNEGMGIHATIEATEARLKEKNNV